MAVFEPFTKPVDTVVLGGFATPGLARLVGVSLDYEWEVRKGNAISGARKILKGRGLTKCTLEVTLYTEDEIAAWEDFFSLIRYPEKAGNQTLKGYQLVHPLAALYGIDAVTVTTVMPMVQESTGEWTTGLELEEYREPVVIARKASGTKASPKATDVDPIFNSPELAEATKQLERERALNKAAGL